jgi:xanthine dehydrogenase accessory factor
LMIVVKSLGSSPGREGFKMAVAEDNTLYGSIGGGVMEVNLVEIAKKFLTMSDEESVKEYKHPFLFTSFQVHRKGKVDSSGMICNGKQCILFFKIKAADYLDFKDISKLFAENSRAVLEISLKNGLRIITPKDVEFKDAWNSKDQFSFLQKNRIINYREKLGCKNNLYVIGGGHCALALSELMSKLGFHISLFDDRPNLNTLEKNRFANSKTIIDSYENIGEFIESGQQNYVVVMTIGYKFDEIVIRKLFDKNFKYFGVLGSLTKMKTLLKSLETDGFDKEKLAHIRTPIGLKINSRTPEEIAVSIAAEIISIKNFEQ